MKLLEMKNKLALETAVVLFQNAIDAIFIGGTALNTFYLDYRYSEDLDLAYTGKNIKPAVEQVLQKQGYEVQRSDLKHRDIIAREGISIKLDMIEYQRKYDGTEIRLMSGVRIPTLRISEFFVEKTISFFTREEWTGLGRDAYDLFWIDKEYGLLKRVLPLAKTTIQKNVSSFDLNVRIFQERSKEIEETMAPYLRKPVGWSEVYGFLILLRGAVHD